MTDCSGPTAPIPVAASVTDCVETWKRYCQPVWQQASVPVDGRKTMPKPAGRDTRHHFSHSLMRLAFFALPLLLCLTFNVARAAASSPRAPNIVILLADDLGRADLGYAGSEIKTPNIDRLVTTGVRLDRFYVCPVCSPTRAGLLTGRWPIRHGIMRTVIPPWSTHGLPLEERTLADALREAGYARRGVFGKWHLGHAKRAFLPPQRGFTHFYGHYNGALDYFTHVREGEVDWHRDNETVKEEGYTTDLIAREAVRFVEEAPASSPFFLYVPFNAPHSPFQAKPDDLARYPNRQGNKRTYAAMIDSMDQAIGRILAAVEKRSDADNTFVLFFSDNGGHTPVASNAPMRDGKFSVYEGGIRVAAAVRWPAGGLKGGRFCAEPMGYIDVFPTALRLAGVRPAASAPPLDGRDVLDVMRGEKAAPERPWFSYIAPQDKEDAAVNVGAWKLVLSGGAVLKGTPDPATKVELYNIVDDPHETKDLAAKHPEHVARLRKLMGEFGAMQKTGVAAYAAGRQNFKAPKDWVIAD
jgi:arylsulfatase B